MVLNERQREILEILEGNQKISSAKLARRLFVSEMTIRRDLRLLEGEGLLKRYHGGAVALDGYTDYPLELRIHLNEKEKREIAAKADAYIQDGQTVFMHSSSTCAYIVPRLKGHKDITVITNSVQIMLMLARTDIPCLLSGGEYYKEERCLIGSVAENFIREIYTDIAFISCSGVSEDGAITEIDAETAQITKIAFKNAAKRILVVDRSKLNRRYPYHICNKDEVDEIICL